MIIFFGFFIYGAKLGRREVTGARFGDYLKPSF